MNHDQDYDKERNEQHILNLLQETHTSSIDSQSLLWSQATRGDDDLSCLSSHYMLSRLTPVLTSKRREVIMWREDKNLPSWLESHWTLIWWCWNQWSSRNSLPLQPFFNNMIPKKDDHHVACMHLFYYPIIIPFYPYHHSSSPFIHSEGSPILLHNKSEDEERGIPVFIFQLSFHLFLLSSYSTIRFSSCFYGAISTLFFPYTRSMQRWERSCWPHLL